MKRLKTKKILQSFNSMEMEVKSLMLFRLGLLVLALGGISSATLSPTGINYEG